MKMRKSLIMILGVISLVVVCGCTENHSGKASRQTSEQIKVEKESQVKLDYDNKELVQQMMDIVGCSDRSAASMLRSIESCTESNIASIEQVDCDSTIELKVIDESGNVYYAYKGHSYIISSIYKDKDKDGGERIFHMIE